MIFLTIGSHEPFDRLVRALDEWCQGPGAGQVVFGQITAPRADGYQPRNFEWVSRLTPVDYAARVARADLIVSHAGMGSIITALHDGKPIVVMPRRGHLRETRNDHQYTTARRLAHRPGIYVAEDETQLAEVIARALDDAARRPDRTLLADLADPGFTSALRSFLLNRKDTPD